MKVKELLEYLESGDRTEEMLNVKPEDHANMQLAQQQMQSFLQNPDIFQRIALNQATGIRGF